MKNNASEVRNAAHDRKGGTLQPLPATARNAQAKIHRADGWKRSLPQAREMGDAITSAQDAMIHKLIWLWKHETLRPAGKAEWDMPLPPNQLRACGYDSDSHTNRN